MNALTQQWIRKAEEDYRVGRRELAVRRGASLDAVCFHAQQCAEKYLKGVLQETGLTFPKTHDLEALINLLLPTQPQWSAYLPAAKVLASHAVEARYLGQWATRADAEAASDGSRFSSRRTADSDSAASSRSKASPYSWQKVISVSCCSRRVALV